MTMNIIPKVLHNRQPNHQAPIITTLSLTIHHRPLTNADDECRRIAASGHDRISTAPCKPDPVYRLNALGSEISALGHFLTIDRELLRALKTLKPTIRPRIQGLCALFHGLAVMMLFFTISFQGILCQRAWWKRLNATSCCQSHNPDRF